MMEEMPFPLKKPGVNFVFADGNPNAELMVVGEAPGEEENRLKLPFMGQAGKLLDQMLSAIGISRANENPKLGAY
ncbi:MAG TPA: uracil-DNA glycosylase, partial [Alphaproteobacteria bacterium]|nr:uracil-DNA glycosylase [Alphaproteobacteria bacterium]